MRTHPFCDCAGIYADNDQIHRYSCWLRVQVGPHVWPVVPSLACMVRSMATDELLARIDAEKWLGTP